MSIVINKLYIVLVIFLLVGFLSAQTQDENANAGDEVGFESFLIDFNKTAANKTSEDFLYHNDNWDLKLSSSSDFAINKKNSFAKNVTDKEGINYMGVRVDYPNFPNNSYASLKPPLPFLFRDLKMKDGMGVLSGVKVISKIVIKIAGRYFPYQVKVTLADVNGKVVSYKMGDLYFYGWKEREWVNKNYLGDRRGNEINRVSPVYPRILPSVKLVSIDFIRGAEQVAGNFISYVSWIKLFYEKVFDIETIKNNSEVDDLDDEDIWKIKASQSDGSYDKLFESFKLQRDISRSRLNYKGKNTDTAPKNSTTTPTTNTDATTDSGTSTQ